MPEMTGDRLLIELHSLYPDSLKILLTGQADADALGNLVNADALYRYVAKPWEETDLPNRTLFDLELEQTLYRIKQTDKMLAVMVLDFDRFKTINDTLGHRVGDLLLKKVVTRLNNCVREQRSDTKSCSYKLL